MAGRLDGIAEHERVYCRMWMTFQVSPTTASVPDAKKCTTYPHVPQEARILIYYYFYFMYVRPLGSVVSSGFYSRIYGGISSFEDHFLKCVDWMFLFFSIFSRCVGFGGGPCTIQTTEPRSYEGQ